MVFDCADLTEKFLFSPEEDRDAENKKTKIFHGHYSNLEWGSRNIAQYLTSLYS